MALKLDDNLLTEIGLGALPVAEKSKMLKHIYETLEMRVGVKLAERMSDQQLDEFEAFINSGDEAGALRWLETTFPDYKNVVAQEFESLKSEIRQVAPQIVAEASQAQAQEQSPSMSAGQYSQPQQSPYPPQQPPAYGQQPTQGYYDTPPQGPSSDTIPPQQQYPPNSPNQPQQPQ